MGIVVIEFKLINFILWYEIIASIVGIIISFINWVNLTGLKDFVSCWIAVMVFGNIGLGGVLGSIYLLLFIMSL